jgi:hypothetical protein
MTTTIPTEFYLAEIELKRVQTYLFEVPARMGTGGSAVRAYGRSTATRKTSR